MSQNRASASDRNPLCPSNHRWTVTPQCARRPWRTHGRTDRTALANIGYVRVSTRDQNLSLQLDASTAAGRKKAFEDRASGARADRAGLQAALDCVQDGEVLVV